MTPAAKSPAGRILGLITLGGFYSFLIFGFVDNLKGPTLPALLGDLSLSYSQGGAILFGAYLGFLIATLAAGVLADALGNRLVLLLAGLLLAAGSLAFSFGDRFWVLFGGMAIFGLGTGSIEVGGNALIVELHGPRRGRYLNLLGVFHGIGALLAPLYVARLLQTAYTWRQVHRFSVLPAILLAAYFLVMKYPHRRENAAGGFNPRSLRRTGFSGAMPWYYLIIAFYVAAELGTAAWLVEYLQEVKAFGIGRSSLYLSLFFGFIMAGRIAGSFIVDRVGYLRSMLVFSIASILSMALGILGPPGLTFFIPVAGLFFSIIFPTVTAAASALHRENTGTILGLLCAFAGVGGALGPWAIGIVADLGGIQAGISLVLLYCLVVLGALVRLAWGPKVVPSV